MKKQLSLWFSFLFSFLLFSASVPAQTNSPDSAFVIPEDPEKPLVTILDNGLEVAIKNVPTSELISCQLWVRAGSITEGKYIGSGISHYLEHLLFKGTEKRGVGEIAQEVERLGGYINAYTSFDRTVFTIDLPAEYLEEALDILSDAAVNAVIDPVEFEKEKMVILQELSFSNDDPQKKSGRLLWQNAFRTHPYKNPVIGYKPVFEKITRENVVDYYHTRYIPNNMLLVIAGKVDPESAFEMVKQYFEPLERKSLPPETIPQEPPQLGARKLIVEKDIQKSYFYLAVHGPSVTSPDVAPIDVLAVILGQGKSSRLYKKVREEKKLAYSVESWSYTPKEPGLFAVNATLNAENIEPLREAIWEEIKRIQREGVSETEVRKAQASLLKDTLSAVETASGAANTLGSNLFSAEDPHYDRLYLKQVMAVKPKEVQRVAQEYFSPEKEILTVLRSRKTEEEKMTAKEDVAGSKTIYKKELDNGIKLLVRSIPGLPYVSLKAVFRGGVLTETEKTSGVSHMMSQLFLKGTKEKSREVFMSELEELGGDLSPYSGYNSFGTQMSVLFQNWKPGLALLAELLQNPRFEEEDLINEKNIILAGIRAKDDEPFDAAAKLLRETLFLTHPYRMQTLGNLKSVENLTLKQVKDYYKKYVTPNNLVLAVVGDVKPGQVESFIADHFNRFVSKKPPRFKDFSEKPQRKVREKVKWKEVDQAIVAVGFHTVDLYNPDQYVLEVIASIYSGQGSRLFKSVREELGLAYTLGAYQVLGLDPGFFTFYAGTRPDKAQKVIDIILKEIELLKKEGITEEELERAQNGLIGRHKKNLESSSRFAFKVALDELYGLGAENYKEYAKRIRAVTRKDVTRVAEKYFNERAYSLVEVKPAFEAKNEE